MMVLALIFGVALIWLLGLSFSDAIRRANGKRGLEFKRRIK